ncbi:MAG: PAS domain-containing protein [Pseudomonadota bacterium]
MKHKNNKQLYQYWNEIKDGQRMPDRSALHPSALGPLLGDMFILNNDEEALVPTYRLAGTRLCALYAHDLKHLPFAHHWSGRDRIACEEITRNLGDDGQGMIIGSMARSRKGRMVHLETLLLPLMHQGQPGCRIVGSTTALEQMDWLGADPIVEMEVSSLRMLRPNSTNAFDANRPLPVSPSPVLASQAMAGRRIKHLVVMDGGRTGSI